MARYSYPAVFVRDGDRLKVTFIDFPESIPIPARYDQMLFAERRLIFNLSATKARRSLIPKATPFLKIRPAEGEQVKLITVEWGD